MIGLYLLLISASVVLWALSFLSALSYPVILALGLSAFTLGLRHAFDADHIAAIDNVTRKLMQENKKPVAVGFFFSLGHSTVVFMMAALVAAGAAFAASITNDNSPIKQAGALIGTSVSAIFLFALAIMNLVILAEVVKTFRKVTHGGTYDEAAIEEYLSKRGFFARIFRGIFKSIDKSWKMYPLGFRFGLGFDTATEIILLGLAGSAAGNLHLPVYVTLLLPLLFTVGMSLADTTDGVMMLGAYGWAFVNPVRKLYYNVTITLISVIIALVIGSIETLGIFASRFKLSGGVWDLVGSVGNNFGQIGVGIIVVFVLSWGLSTVIYRVNRYDQLEARVVTPAPPATD